VLLCRFKRYYISSGSHCGKNGVRAYIRANISKQVATSQKMQQEGHILKLM
jgi:hypothetical protein